MKKIIMLAMLFVIPIVYALPGVGTCVTQEQVDAWSPNFANYAEVWNYFDCDMALIYVGKQDWDGNTVFVVPYICKTIGEANHHPSYDCDDYVLIEEYYEPFFEWTTWLECRDEGKSIVECGIEMWDEELLPMTNKYMRGMVQRILDFKSDDSSGDEPDYSGESYY